MRLEEIKDKPVIGIAKGQKLGEVQDVLLDTSYVQVAALVIGGGGLFGGPKRAVEYESVRGIGPDAVMVSGPDAIAEIVDPSPLAALHPVADLDQTVLSESGVRLGKLVGAAFDPQSGAVTTFLLAPNADGPLAGAASHDIAREALLSITDKLAVVRHAVLDQRDEPHPAPNSGVVREA